MSSLLCAAVFLILGLIAYIVVLHCKFSRYHNFDSVTGFWTLQKIETEIDKELAKKKDTYYMFIASDFRNFKYMNETWGKASGDALLKKTAGYLLEKLRKYSFYIARGFADHFYIFIPLKCGPGYFIFKMLKECTDDILVKNVLGLCSKSGIVFVNPSKKTENFNSLIGKASYAKKMLCPYDKYSFKIFDSNLEKDMSIDVLIEKKFSLALKQKEICVFYQPQVDLVTQEITGAEALVRWNDPKLGLMCPDMFIGALEKSGNIRQLDFYVYEQVCRFIRSRLNNKKRIIPISMNMSRQHLDSDDFADMFSNLMKKYDIPPELLKVEILERHCNYNLKNLKRIVKKLHNLGVVIAIDDFGTGESSLGMLNEIPVDEIKLDRQFIKIHNDSMQDQNVRSLEKITESVLGLAKRLGKKTLCEGAETQEQVDFLKTVACDTVQGFYFSKPLEEEKFLELL